jgi:hypothetical protein
MSRLVWLLQAILSLFFLFAGLSKLLDPAAFSLAIERYQLVGAGASWAFALWIPWLECITAFSVWSRRWRVASVFLLAGLLIAFQAALLSALVRGLDISCGCFGSAVESSVLLSLLRNFFLLGGVLILIIRKPQTA